MSDPEVMTVADLLRARDEIGHVPQSEIRCRFVEVAQLALGAGRAVPDGNPIGRVFGIPLVIDESLPVNVVEVWQDGELASRFELTNETIRP